MEQSQKTFDNTLARYVSQSKTKEPSSLREDAFQVHETRKAYIKASLDFCILAPQLRYTIDKLLIRVSSDQWREMRRSREVTGNNFAKWSGEMDRVRGWSKEMEAGESVFRRELQVARREIAEIASEAAKPSRELEDYHLSTVVWQHFFGGIHSQRYIFTNRGLEQPIFQRSIRSQSITWQRRRAVRKAGLVVPTDHLWKASSDHMDTALVLRQERHFRVACARIPVRWCRRRRKDRRSSLQCEAGCAGRPTILL